MIRGKFKGKLLIVVLALVLASPCLSANSEIDEGFESGRIDSNLWTEHEAEEDRVTINSNKARDGNYSVHFRQWKGDPKIAGGGKAGIQSKHGSISSFGWDGWLGFSMYHEQSVSDILSSGSFNAAYHHNGTGPTPVGIAHFTERDEYRFVRRWGVSGDDYEEKTYILGKPSDDAGRWVDWVIHIKYSPSGDNGTYQVYKDGNLIINENDVNVGYSSQNENYLNLNVYTSVDRLAPEWYELWFDEIRRISSANGGSFAAVTPTIRYIVINPSPAKGAIKIPVNAYLSVSVKKDHADGQNVFSLYQVEFRVSDRRDMSNILWSEITRSTSIQMPRGVLSVGNTYYWDARARSQRGNLSVYYWGDRSVPSSFTTSASQFMTPQSLQKSASD